MSGDQYKIADQNALYFLTFTIVGWLDVFTRKEYKLDIVDSLNFCHSNKGLVIYSWCLMSNHLHLICRAKEPYHLSGIIRDFKKFTAKRILYRIENEPESRRKWMLNQFEYAGRNLKRIKKYKFWKDDNHAILLEKNYLQKQKLNYIHQNPVKALIVDEPEDYLFSSARDYCGIKGLVNIEFMA
ncbi:transposase [Echinicola sediminis]